ncbi:MAG: hypothetical protein V1808_01095 [Candidatus Daviesbacteria bacterium]
MKPEQRKEYLVEAENQRVIAVARQAELAKNKKELEQGLHDSLDRAAMEQGHSCSTQNSPKAWENAKALIKSFPQSSLSRIEHGATFKMTITNTEDNSIEESGDHTFIDPSHPSYPILQALEDGRTNLPAVPKGMPGYFSANSAIGKLIKGQTSGYTATHSDFDDQEIKITICEIE